MKIRIKFAKTGVMKFVGHLDVMRYFQKAIRRAELPIAYSEGFSPHMLLSFASPLGVGISSTGEYFDMVLAEDMKTDEIVSGAEEVLLPELDHGEGPLAKDVGLKTYGLHAGEAGRVSAPFGHGIDG